MMKTWLAALILLSPFFTKALAEPDRVLQASTLNYPPYQYIENERPKGIAVDMIKEALTRAGPYQVDFKFYPWKRAVHLTEHGQSDLLFNAGKNRARHQWGRYVNSVLIEQSYVLFKRKNHSFSVSPDYSDTQDKVISIRSGYLYGDGFFRQAIDDGRFLAVMHSDSTAQSVKQLLNKRIDMFIGDQLPVLYYIKEQGLEDQIDMVLYDNAKLEVLYWPTYILFSKKRVSPQLVSKVNQAMEAMKLDGTYDQIIRRYTQ